MVEDELLISMDIVQALERAGANATMTTTVRHALILVENDGLSAAIMDHALSDGDSTMLCARLKERGIPYVSYSGYDPVKGASKDAPHGSGFGSGASRGGGLPLAACASTGIDVMKLSALLILPRGSCGSNVTLRLCETRKKRPISSCLGVSE